jgi:hypothetical protein
MRTRNPGIIRPTYAGVFDLSKHGYDHARDVVLDWIRTNIPVRESIGAIEGFEFDHESNEVRVQAARNSDDTLTVLRLQHPEYDRKTRIYDRVRNWRTDITIGRDDEGSWIAARQWFKGVADDVRKVYPPKFIRTLWDEKALSDGLVLETPCFNVEYAIELDRIVELINDEERAMPVVVMAEGCPLDPERVARDSVGLAHVIRIPRAFRYQFNAALTPGQELVHGAVRTFYPKVVGRELIAPAARWETIIDWRFAGLAGPAAFGEWLHAELGRAVVSRLLNDAAHKSYEDVRAAVLEKEQNELVATERTTTTLEQSIVLLQGERDLLAAKNSSLEEQLAELSTRVEDISGELSQEHERYSDERAEVIELERRVIDLQFALANKSGSDFIQLSAAEVENLIEKQAEPKSVAAAVEAAERIFMTYGTKIVFSDTALETALESPFMRPGDVLAALLRLGFLWHEVGAGKRREDRARELLRFNIALHESDTVLNNKKLMAERRAITPDGEEVFFEKHIKLGGGPQNATTSLCIYFGDKDGEILVGRVGSHPTGAKTQ